MKPLLFLLATVLCTSAVQAQPCIGVVPNAETGYTSEGRSYLCYSVEGRNDGCVFFLENTRRGSVSRMNVDGRTTAVRKVGRERTQTAYDRQYRVTRTYSVSNYRAADGSFTAELWERNNDTEGGDCVEMRGGLTVRKGGRQTHVRVEGQGCTF